MCFPAFTIVWRNLLTSVVVLNTDLIMTNNYTCQVSRSIKAYIEMMESHLAHPQSHDYLHSRPLISHEESVAHSSRDKT